MSELEAGSPDSNSIEEKTSHFTQAGQLNEPSLIQLRDQIKKVMIPLLIKTFQFKLELSQSLSLPSRLQSQKNHRSPEEILEQLKTLDNDLKVLFLWCQSCRAQIQKAFVVPEEDQKNTIALPTPDDSHCAVSKSFSEAVSAQTSFFQQQQPVEAKPLEPSSPSAQPISPKSWWEKLMGK
jgi:endoglucanase Acf2